MSWLTAVSLKIRKRETPFYDRLYKICKAVLNMRMPVLPGLHKFLYWEWAIRTSIWHNFWRCFYYEPMFISQCRKVGKRFKLWYAGNGTCRILGNLLIHLGDDVTFFDNISLVGLKLFDSPTLRIGNNVYVGPNTKFMVAKEIAIGDNSILGSGIRLMDNPGHSSDAEARLGSGGGLPSAESVAPIHIGEFVFLGAGCRVYPGAHVGDGVLARVDAHLIGDIPPFSVVGGNPGKVTRLLPIPASIIARVGKERHQVWKNARRDFVAAHPQIKNAELA